jgi:hypothetical protein
MPRNTKKNRKTQKKQKTWTGGVRINEDYIGQYGRKTRAECMKYFMENATFKLLTNNSASCMTILATLPNNYKSIFKSMRSNDIDISVRTLLVKIFLTIPTNENVVYHTNYKRGNHGNTILITPISDFRQEIQTQKDIYRKSFVSETSLLDPICPAILFFQDKIPNLELSKYLEYFNHHDPTAYALLRDIIGATQTRPDIRVSTIYMEFMEDYQLVNNIFDSRTNTNILSRNLRYRQEEYEFFLKIIQYELYKLNQLGYIHNDAHLANMMIDPDYDYFAVPDPLSHTYHISSGKVILIDFGKTEKLLSNVNPYESVMSERFMAWVPRNLRITLDEIREYEQYRKNYIKHVSGPKILQKFNVRNKTLFELVQFMANQEQFITTGGKATTIHRTIIDNWMSPKESVVLHKKHTVGTKEITNTDNAKTEEENINTFIQFFEPHYNDKELEELLKTEPNIGYEKDTELEQILLDNPMKSIYRKHSPQTHKKNTIRYKPKLTRKSK